MLLQKPQQRDPDMLQVAFGVMTTAAALALQEERHGRPSGQVWEAMRIRACLADTRFNLLPPEEQVWYLVEACRLVVAQVAQRRRERWRSN